MTTTHHAPSITQESQNHQDSSIQRKQDEILQLKQRLLRLQVELSNMKKRKASMRSVNDFREQLRAVMRPG
jgi:molecular chaperone GrpE (heat shock protein)